MILLLNMYSFILINVLFKVISHEEEQLGEAHHNFELNAEKTQSEQECQSEEDLDDLKSNKNEVTFKIVTA